MLLIALVAVGPWLNGWLNRPSSQPFLSPTPRPEFLGVLFGITGCGFFVFALLKLGKNFTVLAAPVNHATLATSGVYGLTRNPMYFGVILMTTAWSSIFQSGLTLVFVSLLIATLRIKIHLEEASLKKKFGSFYDAYCRRTKRLVPFIY
jgi:protein-S-isoprenylcysteine O-methyltransferase Ste14